MNLENFNEKHTLHSNVPNSNSHGENEEQSCKSLITQSLPLNDLNLDLDILPMGWKKWWRL